MAVFKQLGGGNYTVEPFEVNYSHSFAWISGSADVPVDLSGSGFSINLANEPPTNYPTATDSIQDLGGVTDGGFYSYPLFNSVKNYFYVGEDGVSFTLEYGDLDLIPTAGSQRYCFNVVGGKDDTAGGGTKTDAGLKVALSLILSKSDRYAADNSTLLNTVTVGDIVTYKISDRRWYKYKITSVDIDNPSPIGLTNTVYSDKYRFGIEFIDSDTYDSTAVISTDAWTVGPNYGPKAKFEFTGPGGDIYGFYPSGSMFVWNVGSNYSGEGIKPDTFKIELDEARAGVNLTGASYNNATTITHASNAGVKVGMFVTGTGIPAAATVVEVEDATEFELSVATTGDSLSSQALTLTFEQQNIQDDGTGKLKLNKTGSVVGNISYSNGIATVQRNITASSDSFISEDGISILKNNSDWIGVTSSFQSIVNIYEHTATCKVEPSEYNVTLNPTSFSTVNTLLSLTGASYDNETTITHATNANVKVGMWVIGTGIPVGATVVSVTSDTVFQLSEATSATGAPHSSQTLTLEGLGTGHYSNRIDSGSALPFITTIGLYNDFNELLVVGKLSKPITRMKYSDQTFVIKFDE